ncbi:MAG: ABC transporter permease [Deltaproteobacteria bacterium]|nr:ABC transporter permease [Deltaproteobacteria bacterium]
MTSASISHARLRWLVLVACAAAVPEALVRSADEQVAFQAMLVVQLLGVIVAALAVAAAFSALGLAAVWRASRPLQSVPSTFVAWAFLRAPRQVAPWPLRVASALVEAVGAGPGQSARVSVRQLGLAMVLGATGAATLVWQREALATGDLCLRNVGAALALHGALLAVAGLPSIALRKTLLGLACLAGLVGAGVASRHPAVLPYLDPLALLAAAGVVGALALARPGDGAGQAARLARRARWVLPLGVSLCAAGAALHLGAREASAGVAVASAGAAAALVGIYLLLQGQAKVTVPVFVSIVGVAAGTWALIVVLSVMGGFASDLRNKMLVANAHALVEAPGRATAFGDAAQLAARLRKVPGVLAVSPQVRGDAILSSSFNVHNFVGIRGIDPDAADVVREFEPTLRTGSLGLLRDPTGLGSDRSLQRRPVGLADDVPAVPMPAPTTAPAAPQTDADAVLKALGQLPPGPTDPGAPQPEARKREKLPGMLLLGSDGEKAEANPGAAPAPPLDLGSEPIGAGHRPQPSLERPSALHGAAGLLGADDDVPAATREAIDAPVPPGLLVGVELARTLQAEVGDKVEVVTPDGDIGPTGLRPRVRTFRIAGTFETGLYEADSKVAYMTIDEAARYFNLEGEANVLELRLTEPENPDAVVEQLRTQLARTPPPAPAGGKALEVLDWRQLNRSLFSALAFERLVIFLVLGLIILVAAFSIVSALTMVILQKHDSIAMLRAMGAGAGSVRAAFVQMGGAIGVIGTAAGLVLGIGTCKLVELLGIQLPEAYYVRTLPVRLHVGELCAVVAASLAISLLATVFPARGAARLHPLEGLRHG